MEEIKKNKIENRREEGSQKKAVVKGAARSALGWIKNNFNKGTILSGAIAASSFANAKDINKTADNEFLNSKTKIEYVSAHSTDTTKRPSTASYNTKELKSKLKKENHGDLGKTLENKKASLENDVFNSFEELASLIEKKGKEGHFYSPQQVGPASPYWGKKRGDVKINNFNDYKKHIENDLKPFGFKGEIFTEVKYFGFNLEKNEFITDLKYDIVVRAKVMGGEGYVLLKKGTGVIMVRSFNEKGEVCNKIVYILDCINPVLADDPFTNSDGSGGFRL